MSKEPGLPKWIRCLAYHHPPGRNCYHTRGTFRSEWLSRSQYNFLYKYLLSIERFNSAELNVPQIATHFPEGVTQLFLRLQHLQWTASSRHTSSSYAKDASMKKSPPSSGFRNFLASVVSLITGFDRPRIEFNGDSGSFRMYHQMILIYWILWHLTVSQIWPAGHH